MRLQQPTREADVDNSFGHAAGAFIALTKVIAVACLFMAPLALWKLGEIIWWVASRISISWGG